MNLHLSASSGDMVPSERLQFHRQLIYKMMGVILPRGQNQTVPVIGWSVQNKKVEFK